MIQEDALDPGNFLDFIHYLGQLREFLVQADQGHHDLASRAAAADFQIADLPLVLELVISWHLVFPQNVSDCQQYPVNFRIIGKKVFQWHQVM